MQSSESPQMVQYTFWTVNRGPRPVTRGWVHVGGAAVSIFASTVLITVAWMALEWWHALGVTVYGVGLTALFTVSALYHRFPWTSADTVRLWRRADHAMIAVFIAATYTPLCLLVFPPDQAAWTLSIAWIGALGGVFLNMVWIEHPRWLDVVVYLALGWLILPLIPSLWNNASPAVVWLLFAGGVIYTLGAVMYGAKWPGREARYFGYHEYFHAATVIAGIVHFIAVCLVIAEASAPARALLDG